MSTLQILSVNCQGLGDPLKRKDVFNYLKSKNYNMYCLQDTHFTYEIEKTVRSEWDRNVSFHLFRQSLEVFQ